MPYSPRRIETKMLEVRHLDKHYPAKPKPVLALQDISLVFYPAEVLALLGANGAGKTTLSNIIASLFPPYSGEVLWEGRSIYDDLKAYRRLVGYCPQRANLNSQLTLQDNLLFAGRFYGLSEAEVQKNLKALTEQFNLGDYLQAKPAILSGGWKQRFMMARALMHHPKILILDEPTVSLDPQIRRQIWELIRCLKSQNISVLLTTHYMEEAEVLADRVCFMDAGKIKLMDRPENLKVHFSLATLEEVYFHLGSS